MKILHCVESYFPSKGGMQEVVRQLSERLVAAGHEVTVATRKLPNRNEKIINGVQIEEFTISGNLVRGIEGEIDRYKKYLLASDAEIITFFAAQQWATDLALDLLPQLKARKVSVPTGYSGFYQEEYAEYFGKMKSWIQHYDMNVYLSDDYRDINFARENKVKALTIIPNGAAADEFTPPSPINIRTKLDVHQDAFLILHVGSYTGRKGQREAMEIFLRADLPNSALLLIGNDHEGFYRQFFKHPMFGWLYLRKFRQRRSIFFSDFNRIETIAAYQQADLFLFPSNIECSPIVLFECGAAGLPFLTTDVGNSSEIVKWTNGGQVLPTTKDDQGYSHANISGSVKMLRNLFVDKTKRSELAKAGFEAWKNKFTWEIIAKQYEDLYKKLIHDHH